MVDRWGILAPLKRNGLIVRIAAFHASSMGEDFSHIQRTPRARCSRERRKNERHRRVPAYGMRRNVPEKYQPGNTQMTLVYCFVNSCQNGYMLERVTTRRGYAVAIVPRPR
jgi:hypothetical protein